MVAGRSLVCLPDVTHSFVRIRSSSEKCVVSMRRQREGYRNLRIVGARSPLVRFQLVQLFSRMMFWMRVPPAAEVHITFLSMDDMRDFHYQSKGLNRPTDVLSIPGSGCGNQCEITATKMLHFIDETDDDDDRLTDVVCRSVNLRKELQDLGEIAVCPEYIAHRIRRRPNKNLPINQYFLCAYIHAALHVMGYDHYCEDDHRRMVTAEKWLGARIRRDLQRGILDSGPWS